MSVSHVINSASSSLQNLYANNFAYGAQVFSQSPAAGASPRVANVRCAYLQFTGVSAAAGAQVALQWTNSLITAQSIISVRVCSTGAASDSALVFKGAVPGSGSASLVFMNGGSQATGSTTLNVIAEILN